MKWKVYGKKGKYNQDMIRECIEQIDVVHGWNGLLMELQENTVGKSITFSQFHKVVLTHQEIFSHFIGQIIEGKGIIIQTGIALCRLGCKDLSRKRQGASKALALHNARERLRMLVLKCQRCCPAKEGFSKEFM